MAITKVIKNIVMGSVAVATLLPCITQTASAQESGLAFNAPKTGNPIIPGYFADPTVRKFGDTYYVYATTDGNGEGFGPSQVWTSKDFVNWTIMPMNWPITHWYWAPDVWQHNGSYYLMYCQPCQLHLGKSDSPRGPWKNVLGEHDAVLMPDRFVTNCITLDGQVFFDDDGKAYVYFGTWGIYPGFGCGVCELDENMMLTDNKRLIVNTEATEFFEAPFIIKHNGVYYLTYSAGSCHDHTYRVKYAISKTGPMGPYESPADNVILETNADGTIHGPGHHSILEENGKFYMVYHRHDNPHSTRGMHRQIAVDEMFFNEDGSIAKIKGSHDGIGNLQPLTTTQNIAFGKPVTVSSYYSEDYKPQYATDDNNGTLWRPKSTNAGEWIQIDLEETKKISRIWTQFELPMTYYQYYIETSLNGKDWTMFADKRNNFLCGSPMVEYGDTEARYIRLTFTGAEKQGVAGAIWNIKVFETSHIDPPQMLIGLSGNSFIDGEWKNQAGMLGRSFLVTQGKANMSVVDEKNCVTINGELTSSFTMPEQFYNGEAWTLTYKVYGTVADANKQYISWNNTYTEKLAKKVESTTAKQWQNVALICDGKIVTVYINNKEVGTFKNKYAKVPGKMVIKSENEIQLAAIRLYNWAQHPAEAEYDATVAIPEFKGKVAPKPQGLLIDINAADYTVGTTVNEVKNNTGIGTFKSEGSSIPVTLKDNRIAFQLDGSQKLQSTFAMPTNMKDNAPYTMTAWILNPEASERECIVDLHPVDQDGELGRVVFGNGFNNGSGIIFHNGSYEEYGLRDYQGSNEWHHWAVTFDGHMERVYCDGKLINEKNVKLRMFENRVVTIGQTADSDWGFTGWISTVKVYDTPLSAEQIAVEANAEGQKNILFRVAMSEVAGADWKNQAAWSGEGTFGALTANNGKVAYQGVATINNIEAKHNVKGISFTTVWPKYIVKSVNIVKWDGTNIALTRNGLSVNGQNIAIEKQSGWNHIALQAKGGDQWSVWANGKEVGQVTATITNNPTAITIGDKVGKSVISELSIYGKEINGQEIQAMYNSFNTNALAEYNFQLTAKAVTPDYVRLYVTDKDGKDLTESLLLYEYQHGATKSAWDGSSEYLFKLTNKSKSGIESFKVSVKDLNGNITTAIAPATANVAPAEFNIYQDNFDTDYDYHKGTNGTIWDGLFGYNLEEVTAKSEGGNLVLGSKDRNYGAREQNHGPLLYKEIGGDFVAQIHVTDYTGKRGRSVGYNEGGLMGHTFGNRNMNQLVQFGVFPHYNQGNMITYIQGFARIQRANMMGDKADMYLQIERSGDYFYFRSSSDGENWTNMPYSPIYRPDLQGKSLKVGPFQVTYTDGFGEFKFDDFKLWIKK
ncbi:MAG: family 43 glycosylhydrolase [Odoribacter sp.]|nr:family 43 glycosylhydrolase [Odoribacter sp.]